MLKIEIPELAVQLDKAVIKKEGVMAAAKLVAKTYKEDIQNAEGSGRLYGQHQASAPGETPALWTGNLAKSIKAKSGKGLEGLVIDSAWYALALETGSKGGGGKKGSRNKRGVPQTTRVQEARPGMQIALNKNQTAINNLIGEAVLKAVGLKAK